MTKIFFAVDGSYGSADGMAVFDTSGWTDEDWAEIEMAADDERLARAREIQSRVFDAGQQQPLFDINFSN